jgi:cation:H+ antiporter
MPEIGALPILQALGVLLGAALVIVFAGVRLARVADELADRTGMGEIIAGAVFVGGATSLPGAIASMSTAAGGYAQLSIGNAVGGLLAQTMFLVIADLAYRRANLEHAAASVTGLAQGVLLVSLLTIPLIALNAPEIAVFGVHPASLVMVIGYGLGLRLLASIKQDPMWSPVQTEETCSDIDDAGEGEQCSMRRLWLRFALYAGVTALGGYAVGEASIPIVDSSGLSESAVGTLITGVANSLPELVTAIAAVRQGAPNLAVGDIIGGNSFEVLFLAAADVFYREGSIYHAFEPDNVFTVLTAILMTGILLLGMLARERRGVVGIGFESAIVLGLYAGSAVILLI